MIKDSSIRGVYFEIPQEERNTLSKIFSVININDYDWYNEMEQTEVWAEDGNMFRFNADFYNGEELQREISFPGRILFLKLLAFSKESEYIQIHSYDEYLKSGCEIALLIYDCEYAHLYIKDIKKVKKMQKHLSEYYDNIELITDENDSRVSMDIN